MQNDWMKDESLKNIDPYKLDFLQALVFESSSLKKEQMLPFLMAVAKRGQEKKVSFSDEEIDAIVTVLRKHASPDELSKIEKVMAMRSRR
ncbi:MAG: hypothetical protein HFI43_04900 [Lachnospiraceae bacterium]|jgi:glutamyl-tRNA reductase|nr:hypothetical protein [Lachnospiraceae bacterium]NBH24295.1 hypothetical protein [Lachnospiraceae bacterium]GFI17213.1 hypothetical protein IMSAGC009_02382 [Lachnospiraceae bacterium]